jgi:hypothetical protein
MKTNDVFDILKDAIGTAREANVTHVAIEDLERLTAEIESQAQESPEGVSASEASMEHYKAKLAALGRSLQQEHEMELEMLRSVITTGQNALKAVLLINGGAAVALLAFVGSLWNNPNAEPLRPELAYGLSLFVWGVLAAACASGASYLSQAGFGGEFGSRSHSIGEVARWLSVAFVVGSYALFGWGAWNTYVAVSG